MSIPNVNFSSSTYSNNDLINVFPVTRFYYYNLQGNQATPSGTIYLDDDYGTNYAVFTSIYYGYSGSSGTYNATDTSGAVKNIVIEYISNTQFTWTLQKSTGDNVNIYLVFMVVYSNSLDYPKSYTS
jgi:hypothetical protein